MLTLVYGTDWVANRNYIMERLAKDVANKQPRRILLVPELISHDTERRLCSVAGDTCSRYAEVLSFSRLTQRICDWAGTGMEDCLDNGGRLVAIAAAARQLHSKLKTYAAVETNPEFLSSLIDAIDEFKRCCITSADLFAAAKQTQGVFAQKLEELALLLQSYDAICQQGKRDPRDQLTWGLEQLNSCDFAQNHVFYIDGFPDFTMQNLAVISCLIENAPHVIVSMNCDKPGSERLAFAKAGDTAAKLLRIAKQYSVKTNPVEVPPEQSRFLPVCECLFQGKVLPLTNFSGRIRTVQASSIYEECVFAAEYILELIQNGARYRDISLICTDLSAYQNALTMQFQLCGIPVYFAGKEDILEKSVIVTVLSAMDASLGGFETKDVLRYLKSALSPLDLDACDKLESYVLLWNIQGKKWQTDWTLHPDGLVDAWTQENIAYLEELNQYRKIAIDPLVNLSKGFSNAISLSQQVQTLVTFLSEIHLQSRLADLAIEMDTAGDNRSAQILNQLWDILLLAMEQMSDTLGQMHWDNDSFLRLFRLLLSQYDVGTIPPVLDTLTVGPVSAMRCQQPKHLVIIGAAEGSFPSYSMSSGVLTDFERNTLRQLGVPLTGGASEGLEIEFSEIYSAVCAASESVYVSCPEGQGSFVFRRLCEMSKDQYKPMHTLGAASVNAEEAAAYLCRNHSRLAAKELGIEALYQQVKDKASHQLGNITETAIRNLYGNQLNLSASQIDKQADCRFAYFLKYGLRAKEQKAVTVDPAEFGTYVHYVLEQTARDIRSKGGFKAVTLSETMDLAQHHSDIYTKEHFGQIDSQRITYLFRRNHHELMMVVEELWDEFQHSSFEALDFEVAFGDQMQMPAIEIHGNIMSAKLRGFVDRVDVWNQNSCNYFKVVDYKTGKKDFDYCDVFNGLGLQMLLYLFALEQAGEPLLGDHPIPVGVQYFPARVPVLSADSEMTDEEIEKERQSHWKRKGLVLLDEDILNAMDDSDGHTRLSCKIKKDGSISGDVATWDQLKLLCSYIFRLLGNMVDEIASGNVTPNPYTRGNSHNACRFCPYGGVCHSASVTDRRNYKIMSSQQFWDEITKEMSKHER